MNVCVGVVLVVAVLVIRDMGCDYGLWSLWPVVTIAWVWPVVTIAWVSGQLLGFWFRLFANSCCVKKPNTRLDFDHKNN